MVAAADRRVGFYLGVATPLNHYDFGFLRQAICPIALIGATRDEHCDASRFEALYLSLPRRPGCGDSIQPTISRMPLTTSAKPAGTLLPGPLARLASAGGDQG